MKWESVKLQVAREVYTMVSNLRDEHTRAAILRDLIASGFNVKSGLSSHELANVYADKAYDTIMSWDVRSAGRLRDLFPGAFPPSLRKGRLTAYMADNDNSDWMIESQP